MHSEIKTYKSIALGSTSDFIRNNHSLQDLTILFEMLSQGLFWCFPRQPSNKHFRQCGITKLPYTVAHCHSFTRSLLKKINSTHYIPNQNFYLFSKTKRVIFLFSGKEIEWSVIKNGYLEGRRREGGKYKEESEEEKEYRVVEE